MISSIPPGQPGDQKPQNQGQAALNAQAASGNEFGKTFNNAMSHAAQIVAATSDSQKQQFKQKKISETEYTGYEEDEDNEPEHLMKKRLKEKMRALVKLERLGLKISGKRAKESQENTSQEEVAD